MSDTETNDKVTHGQISTWEKFFAGLLLVTITAGIIVLIIGFWPDKLPTNNSCNIYSYKLFHIELMESCDSMKQQALTEKPAAPVIAEPEKKIKKDSVSNDTIAQKDSLKDTAKQTKTDTTGIKKAIKKSLPCYDCNCDESIQFNTLLLILVALCGFLGNMIHIATSFTTFVGANEFKRSWLMWYCVKPFTASALAITFYFVFRGGFLNYASDAALNIYGIMTMAMLTGLFTDNATLKLKEIFEVAFKAKDDRPNTLSGTGIKITDVTPDKLDKTKENIITIKGENLDKAGLKIKINLEVAAYTVSADKSIVIKYTIPPTQTAATIFKIQLLDKDDKIIYVTNLTS